MIVTKMSCMSELAEVQRTYVKKTFPHECSYQIDICFFTIPDFDVCLRTRDVRLFLTLNSKKGHFYNIKLNINILLKIRTGFAILPDN